jgi:hypothetical protein
MIGIELARVYGRIGAYEQHSRHSAVKTTEKARAAAFRRFEDFVDPEHVLDPEERHTRALAARHAELLRMSLKSREVRRARKLAASGLR